MKIIEQWEADDGSIWSFSDEAQARDEIYHECREKMEELGLRDRPIGHSIDFGNGDGFVQQPKGSRAAIYEWVKLKGWHRDIEGPIRKLEYRAASMDCHDREWGQVYYALNPYAGKQREVGT